MENENEIRNENNHSNICMLCHNAGTGSCSWDKKLIPVEGWTADWIEKNKTWHVTACPEFAPDSKHHEYSTTGCIGLLIRLAKEAGEEYREALKGLKAAEQSGNEYAIKTAEGRLAVVSKFLEGYEADAGHTREKSKTPAISPEDAEELYWRDVVNDPDKNSSDVKVRVSKARYKAMIVASARPCGKCKYFKSLSINCHECDFEHSKWEPSHEITLKRRNLVLEVE